MEYESTRLVDSSTFAGVRYRISRISFGRRLELTRRVRELGRRVPFDEAGESLDGKLGAAIARAEIDRLYIEWGLESVEGLRIDGEPADRLALIEKGPEKLFREMSEEIRRECGLSDDERKN